MSFIRWERPRGSVHDLQHALSLAESGCNVLVISDASMYVLQNWLDLDLTFAARWADTLDDQGYTPIDSQSPNYAAWRNLVEQIQSEVRDMSCDIVPYLERIATALESLQPETSTWDEVLTDLLLPLTEIATGADVLALTSAIQGQDTLCCGSVADLPYFDETPSADPNPNTSTFCDRAWSFARNWDDAVSEVVAKAYLGTTLSMGLVAAIVALISLPVAAIAAIATIAAGAVLDISKEDFLSVIDDLVSDIACAIYNSADASSAKGAIDSFIEAAGLPSVAEDLLKLSISMDALNAIFGETYPIRSDSSGSDCEQCLGDFTCLSFGAHTYDFAEMPGHDCGSFNWSSEGHDAAGSIHLFISTGCESEIAQTELFSGIVVHTGDTVTVWAKGNAPDAFNLAVHTAYTDETGDSQFIVCGGSCDWTQITLVIPGGSDGKTIEFVRVQVQKSLNATDRDGWFDDLCVNVA